MKTAMKVAASMIVTGLLLTASFTLTQRMQSPDAVADLPVRPEMPRATLFSEHGQIVSFYIQSAAVGSRKKVNIYLPPGYGRGEERYPVVYLLRGHEGEWLDATSSPSRKGRNAAQIADELIMSGTIPPLILAMPSLASDDAAVISLGVNLPVPARAGNAPGVGPGRFEDLLIKEVLPEVDRRYHTIADRGHRGVDGFSLGGFASVSLALRFPDLFASVGAFEPTVIYTGGRLPNGIPDPYLSEMTVTFGDPPDLELLRRVNPVDLVAAMAPGQLQRLAFHIETSPKGSEDHDRVEAFVQALARKGAVNTFVPASIPGANHGWYWADEHLKRALVKHAEVFVKAP